MYDIHYSAQASYFAVFVESGTRKLRKVVESRSKFLFDVKHVSDSTTVEFNSRRDAAYRVKHEVVESRKFMISAI